MERGDGGFGCQPVQAVVTHDFPFPSTPTHSLQVNIVDRAHMPLVAFSLKDELNLPYTVFEIQDKLRERGWVIPLVVVSLVKGNAWSLSPA